MTRSAIASKMWLNSKQKSVARKGGVGVMTKVLIMKKTRVFCVILLSLCLGFVPSVSSVGLGGGRGGVGRVGGVGSSSSSRCDLVTGGPAARTAAAAQVLEAEVITSTFGGKNNNYTASLSVSRVLKKYRGPNRLKKQDVITLTLQKEPLIYCMPAADLREGNRYFVFYNAPSKRRVAPTVVAAPVPYTRRTKRIIRQLVCAKCGGE